MIANAETQVVRTWDFTAALVKQEQAQRAKQARADHKQQKRLRAQAAALAALTPTVEPALADEEALNEDGPQENACLSNTEDPSNSNAPPSVKPIATGPAHAESRHHSMQQNDAGQTPASGIMSALNSPVPPSQDPSSSAQEDRPGIAWAVGGSRAHEGSTHFQAWHAESHRGAISSDLDSGHRPTDPFSSSPHLAWGGDHPDLSRNNGGFEEEIEDELDDTGDDSCLYGPLTRSARDGGSRRGNGGRLSHAASLGPHEGCDAEQGCDGHCCSLDAPSARAWGSEHHAARRCQGPTDGAPGQQYPHCSSNSSTHSHCGPMRPDDDSSWSRGRRRGAYATSPVPTPIGRRNGLPGAGAYHSGGAGPRSASARFPQEPCRVEAAGMQSWQIIRPRPVACRDQGLL